MVRVLLTRADIIEGDEVILLDSETLHHLKRVVRAELGERIDVLDGEGRVFKGNLVELADRKAVVKVFEEERIYRRPPRIILAVSLLSASRFDEVLDKAGEFGVDVLVPMLCDKTVARLRVGEKKARWQRRLAQVCRAVGTPFLPEVRGVMEFESVLEEFLPRVKRAFIPHLEARSRHLLRELLDFQLGVEEGDELLILIGPEGDFSSDEINLATGRGVIPVTLGPLVLRVETAAGICAGLVHMVRSMEK